MTEPARAMSEDDALAELDQLQSDGLILLEGAASAEQVSLDGWNPATGEQESATSAAWWCASCPPAHG